MQLQLPLSSAMQKVSAYANTKRLVDDDVNRKSLHSTYDSELYVIQNARCLSPPTTLTQASRLQHYNLTISWLSIPFR